MKELELQQVKHSFTVGDEVAELEPNITEDTLFLLNGEPVGFYIRDIGAYSEKAAKLAEIADRELRSKRVPKSEMKRSSSLKGEEHEVLQYSTILGGVAAKPHMRRPYPTVSSVHSVKSAQPFVKAMLMLARESEQMIKDIMPEQYEKQRELIASNSPKKYRFGDLFTSSISNYNISANYHIDKANLKGCLNVIIAKRKDSTGGNTTVPSYGATIDSADNSMLVYPAWKDLHGVTPIRATAEGGYRNTLVFYPLAAFKNYMEE